MGSIEAVVFGNATLDVLCYTVDDVPRYDSVAFEQAVVGPGGCGSNVAIGLCTLGVKTALIAKIGLDDAGSLVEDYWNRVGLDQRFIQRVEGAKTGVSVGLIDSRRQPRFVHTPGANAQLTAEDININKIAELGARTLHIAGFFVLTGVRDLRLPHVLADARQKGLQTSLDVVNSPWMDQPSILWPCLPNLDIFLCNLREAERLTGRNDPVHAAQALRERGGNAIIVKLGADGCWVESDDWAGQIQSQAVEAVDTTGAGDAFAAGLLAALSHGENFVNACQQANAAGARIVMSLGATTGWFT